jgi:aspartate/methionine/tyrosine aminotransferase
MGKLEPFAIEDWMSKYDETPGALNIAEVCSASISVDELVALNSDKTAPSPLNLSTRLTYGPVPGSKTLRTHIANLYKRAVVGPAGAISADDVIVTQGTVSANFLVYYALLDPGDHVVSVYPTFQQLYSLPKSFGAEVSLWKLKPENGFIPDVKELEGLVRANTKVGGFNSCVLGRACRD